MLKKLKVQQFVIIDTLELDFEPRLTIFTGETGAGKSIILGAMGLILGEPSKAKSIRQGHDQSVFHAVLTPPDTHPVWGVIEKHKLLGAGDKTQYTVDRIMKREGADDIKINGIDTTLEVLNEIGEHMVEIHGQFANQSLLGPANQLHLLDLSGAFAPEIFANVANALDSVIRCKNELEAEKKFLSKYKGPQLGKLETLVRRFEDIGMTEGFLKKFKAEYAVLRTAKETSDAFQIILGRLIASNGIVGSLSAAKKTLEAQKNLDQDRVAELGRYLGLALDNARGAVEEMNTIAPEYEIDTSEIFEYEKKITALKTLAAEAKIGFDDLQGYYEDLAGRLKRAKSGRETLERMNNALIEAKNNYRHHAHILTEKRIVAGEELAKAITAEFTPLMLNKAEFQVVVEEKPDIPWTKLGFNEVTFKARMNPGMPFSPIAETASGGELARMILALKVVLQRVQTTTTLVFDEVDTGIGGAAAAAVGERIAHLADNTQILVITHSPQVASRGDQHLHISKKTDGETTISSVRALSMEERIDEISRMLAGDEITAQSQAAAQSLITEAQTAAKARRA